jgi:hypothetical protein
LVEKLDHNNTLDEVIDIPHDDKYSEMADQDLDNMLDKV